MNERIWEIAKQAYSDDMPYDSIIPAEFIVRLSELIVKECANIVTNKVTLETNEDYQLGFRLAKQFIWQDINKHFGVEE